MTMTTKLGRKRERRSADQSSSQDMSDSLADSTADSDITSSADPAVKRERIEELVLAEIDKQKPREDSRRALALIAMTFIRISEEDGESRYVVLNAKGEPRTTIQNGETIPFTLAELAAELRANYPTLFQPEQPETAQTVAPIAPTLPPEEPKAPRDWLMVGSSEEATREGAPAEEQSPSSPAESSVAAEDSSPPARPWRETATKLLSFPRKASKPADEGEPPAISDLRVTEPGRRFRFGTFRPSFAVYAILFALGAILGYGFLASAPEQTTRQITEANPAPPPEPKATGTLTPSPPRAGGTPSGSGALAGVPEVVDTSTLRINGKIVRLFGVEWARGGQAEDLTRYLAGREVACTPSNRPDVYRCHVEGRDLSEVVLYNGGGRATPDATPELKAAEDHARTARIGIWKS